MKTALDTAPALLFFGAYFIWDIYVATGLLIGSLFALVLVYWLWQRKLHKLHLTTAVIAAVLGGLTLYIRDPAFIKFKPTAVYAVIAIALLASHWIGDKVLLQRIPQKAVQLPDPTWRKVNLGWVGFFAGCALLNLYVAASFSEATWVKFKTFGFTGLTFVFLLAHIPFLHQHLPEDEQKE